MKTNFPILQVYRLTKQVTGRKDQFGCLLFLVCLNGMNNHVQRVEQKMGIDLRLQHPESSFLHKLFLLCKFFLYFQSFFHCVDVLPDFLFHVVECVGYIAKFLVTAQLQIISIPLALGQRFGSFINLLKSLDKINGKAQHRNQDDKGEEEL